MWMTPRSTPKVNVIGQRSRSSGKKNVDLWVHLSFDHLTRNIYGQGSYGLGSKVTWVRIKGHMGQGQRSHGLRLAWRSWYWQVGSRQRQVAFLHWGGRGCDLECTNWISCIRLILAFSSYLSKWSLNIYTRMRQVQVEIWQVRDQVLGKLRENPRKVQ